MNKPRKATEKHLGALEGQVMQVLWEHSGLTVREVAGRLPGKRNRAYTTVMTVMNRLFEKGLLERRLTGRAYVYGAKVSQEDFAALVSRRLIRGLLNDFGDAAVAHFVGEMRDLGPGEFEKLKKLVSEEEG